MSDALARPAGFTGFVLREKYSRITCEEPGYEELWAEVRTNLTHAERETFLVSRDENDQRVRELSRANLAKAVEIDKAVDDAPDEKARAKAVKVREAFLSRQLKENRENRIRRFSLVAPYVRAWNVFTDAFDAVPPPCENVEAAYEWTDDCVTNWLMVTCEEAYKGGPKGVRPSKPSDAPPEPTSEPPSENEKAA